MRYRFPYFETDLRLTSSQPDTSDHCDTTDTGSASRGVHVYTPQLSLVLIAPTHGEMARLSRPGWLVVHRDGSLALRQLPILALTGPA